MPAKVNINNDKKSSSAAASHNNNNNEGTANGTRTSKKIGANPDPWPQELTKCFETFPSTSGFTSIDETIKSFVVSEMPEQRTQIFSKLGELMLKVLSPNSSEQQNNSDEDQKQQLFLALLRSILLPIIFDSRVRYLHKAAMNLVRSKYQPQQTTLTQQDSASSSSSSSSFLSKINLEQECKSFARSFLENALRSNKTASSWLRFTNDLDSVSIMIMPLFPSTFDESQSALVFECLKSVATALVAPRFTNKTEEKAIQEDAAATASHQRQQQTFFTDAELAELRFVCRVVTTLFHKYTKIVREEIEGNNNNKENQQLFPIICYLTAINAQMLASRGLFPKDLLNSAGLLVATTLECHMTSSSSSSSSSILSVIQACVSSQKQQQEQNNNENVDLIQERNNAISTSRQIDIPLLLQSMSINGSFALLRGLLSHFSGLKNPLLLQNSFCTFCFEFASSWCQSVEDPEARFLALQTLDSITRYFQEVLPAFVVADDTNNDNDNSSIHHHHHQAASQVLDGIIETLLAVWDDPTMSISGALFDTFDRIVECQEALLSNNNHNNSNNFLHQMVINLLSSSSNQQQHERRGKWQVIAAVLPKMNIDEIIRIVSTAADNSNSNQASSTARAASLEVVSSFLIPILCKCSVNNKLNGLCGDVSVTLAEKMVLSKEKSQQEELLQKYIFGPMVKECLDEYNRKCISVVEEAVATSCSNNNNGGGGLLSQLVASTSGSSSSSYSSKYFINSVVTHLVSRMFRSGKIESSIVVRAMLKTIFENQKQKEGTETNTKTVLQWITVFLAWRAKGADVLIFKCFLQQQRQDDYSLLLQQHTENILLQALASHESDIRVAAVDVLILPHKTVAAAPITKQQFEIANSFFEKNWTTGESAFRNTLVTLIKKFLTRVVETARHSHWREEIVDARIKLQQAAAAAEDSSSAKKTETSSAQQAPEQFLQNWKNYVKLCLEFLVGKLTVRIISTFDDFGSSSSSSSPSSQPSMFAVDRAMTNVIVLQEVQDCVLQFVSINSADSSSAKSASVISDIELACKNNNLSEKFSVSDFAEELVSSCIISTNNNNNNHVFRIAATRLLNLLNNGWTALRHKALALLVRSLSIQSSNASSTLLMNSFIPLCRTSIHSLLVNMLGLEQQKKTLDLIVSASTIRSSSYGVALLHLMVEALALEENSQQQQQQQQQQQIKISIGNEYVFESNSNQSNSNFRFAVAKFICQVADKIISKSEGDTATSIQNLGAHPIHGIISAIGTISSLALSQQQQRNIMNVDHVDSNNQQLLHESISLILRGLKIAASFVGSHSNDVATSSENLAKIDCRGHIIADQQISAKDSRKIVNNAWLAVNLGTEALEKLINCTQLYNNNNSVQKQILLTPSDAKNITETLLKILLESKHNGVISKSRGCLRHIMYGLFRVSENSSSSNSTTTTTTRELRQIPSDTLSILLESDEGVCSKESQRMLRRSQGLPHAIAPILEAEANNVTSVLIPRTMKFLLETSTRAASSKFDDNSAKLMEEIAAKDAIVIHGVNSLNVLKFIFEDSQLGTLARPWVEEAFLVALKGFESQDWFLRNSSLMLFTAVAKRAMGDQAALISRSVGSVRVSNCTTTLSDLALRLPKALPAMAQALAPLLSAQQQQVHNPSVFPILFVLSMLKPSSSSATASSSSNNNNNINNSEVSVVTFSTLHKAVMSCLLSNSLPARVTAASALISVAPYDQVSRGTHIVDAIQHVQQNQRASTKSNMNISFLDALHGLATLVTRTVDILISDLSSWASSSGNNKSVGNSSLISNIAGGATWILEVALNNNLRDQIPSGVWSVILRMCQTLLKENLVVVFVVSSSSSVLSNLIQTCFKFIIEEKILLQQQQQQQHSDEFIRTSADDLFENCHLENHPSSFIKINKDEMLTLGSPTSRLVRAAIQNSLFSNENSIIITKNKKNEFIAEMSQAFLDQFLSPQVFTSLALWQRIHASDVLLSSLGFFILNPTALRMNSKISELIQNHCERFCSEIQQLPPSVFCALTLLQSKLIATHMNSTPHALATFNKTLWIMSRPSMPIEFRLTAARCVSVLLSTTTTTHNSNSNINNTKFIMTTILLAFDDDVSVRQIVSSDQDTFSFVQGLLFKCKHSLSTEMRKEIIDAALHCDEDEGDDDDTENEVEEEDLFAKDQDNAFAERGILEQLLF